METRKITIINSRTQSQKVINNSTATTLGELKAEMREKGIDYSGMTFYEGHLRAELKDDASPLPTNIPYKGQVVNDLTFMLTAPEKKVKSGAMNRKEVYNKITELGLQDECKRKFGRNFTQCTTADLISLVESKTSSKPSAKPQKKEEKPVVKADETSKDTKAEETSATSNGGNGNLEKAFNALLNDLYNNDTIEEETFEKCSAILKGDSYTKPEKMSKKEVDEMFSFINK